jgi:hypothetical protein
MYPIARLCFDFFDETGVPTSMMSTAESEPNLLTMSDVAKIVTEIFPD